MQAQGTAKPSLASHFLDAINAGTGIVSDQDRKANELAAALGNVYLGRPLLLLPLPDANSTIQARQTP
jgi:hypothetical protein